VPKQFFLPVAATNQLLLSPVEQLYARMHAEAIRPVPVVAGDGFYTAEADGYQQGAVALN
jgi:hypothetical protein